MKYPKPELNWAPMVAAILLSGAAHAQDPSLTATHRIVGVQQKTGGQTTVTLDITASNTGSEPLNEVTLVPMPGQPFHDAQDAQPLVIGPIAAGASASMAWSVDVSGPVDADSPALQRLTFAGEANDAFGELLTFPVDSLEVAP